LLKSTVGSTFVGVTGFTGSIGFTSVGACVVGVATGVGVTGVTGAGITTQLASKVAPLGVIVGAGGVTGAGGFGVGAGVGISFLIV